jgi:hypothetical protein
MKGCHFYFYFQNLGYFLNSQAEKRKRKKGGGEVALKKIK